jgi:hypothetical protein
MNSKNLTGLCEAYGGIYAPQELTEDQVWEEVESWVSSLLEEGYDLSDYTWEEMYEAYLEEKDVVKLPGNKSVTTGRGYSATLGGQPGQLTYQRTPGSTNRVQKTFRANPVLSVKGGVKGTGVGKDFKAQPWSSAATARYDKQSVENKRNASRSTGSEANPPSAADAKRDEADPRRNPSTAGSPPSRPAVASGPVLSKKGGVEGTGVGANFKARSFTDAEKSRYSSVAAQNSARSSTSPAASSSRPPSATPAAQPKPAAPTGPAVGKLGSTSFERRTPTSAELKAAQAARAGGASPEKALQAAQKTNLPTTGPTPAIPSASSVSSSMASVKPRDMTKNPLKPTSPTTMKNSYEWGSTSKLVNDIAGLYQSVYEAKKVDQDEDGDNDFADVRIARLIASGVSKEEAIRRVKDKSYNKKNGLGEAAVGWNTGKNKSGLSPEETTTLKFIQHGLSNKPGDPERAEQLALVHQNMTDAIKQTPKGRLKKVGPIASKRFRNAAIRQRGGKQPSVPIKTVPGLKDANREAQSKRKAEESFELWIDTLINEGYDLSEYTWEDMFEIYEETQLDEATRMRKELGKEGETATRKELARRSNAYQRSGSVDRTIAAAERGARNPYVAMGKNETEADYSKRKQQKSKTLTRLASNRRGSVRDKPRAGLRGYAAKVEGDDRDLQSARSSARSAGTLTPAEKKGLGEEFDLWVNALIYEGYDLSEYTWDEMIEIYEETEEERKRNERRARVAELQAQGRVMTSSKRASQKAAQRKQEKKEEMADRLLRSIQASGSTRSSSAPMGTTEPEEKPEAPAANRKLGGKVKKDDLASQANAILRTIKNENIQLWVNELINEGYDLTGWTSKEITKLYFEIFE